MADVASQGGRSLQGWAMPAITVAVTLLGLAAGWGMLQRDREETARRLDRLEQANTGERLAVIETKLDLIASGLGIKLTTGSQPRPGR